MAVCLFRTLLLKEALARLLKARSPARPCGIFQKKKKVREMKKFSSRPATVDTIVLNSRKEVLLVQRGIPPYKGYWALPGGFIEPKEAAEDAAARETKEETGLQIRITRILGVYSSPTRDPRHTIAIAFFGKVIGGKLKGGDDAADARWFPLSKLPKLAFDHAQMLRDAKKLLARA